MSRYIDTDELIFIGLDNPDDDHLFEFVPKEFIDNAPTADVVEVVRCRDCKYMCHYTDGHLECRLLSDLKPIPTTYCTMNADDFCSYGERREDGTA